jgi:myo-inositol-1-phosphate synthase
LPKPSPSLGLWLIGAAGNVAATVAVGLAAFRRGLLPTTGLVTQQKVFEKLGLASLDRIILGGHEVRTQSVRQTAKELHEQSGLFSHELLKAADSDLRHFERQTCTGTVVAGGRAQRSMANRRSAATSSSAGGALRKLRNDLRNFRKRNKLDRMVVINVASTEPSFRPSKAHRRWDSLSKALSRRASGPIPPSSLYALAAIEEGAPYINFTPSCGADLPAIRERAKMLRVPIMGSDGKTGETLLKTAIGPMFRDRSLEVLSWVGHNILGNTDGQVLATDSNRAAKIGNKEGVLSSVLGRRPHSHTSIEYVESLHDWKTAWDHIHFRGFLGTKMSLQLVWQGCDSILAAPLVIDLALLADHYARTGGAGVMTHLSSFFKNPMDVHDHDFSKQIAMLHDYARRHTSKRTKR